MAASLQRGLRRDARNPMQTFVEELAARLRVPFVSSPYERSKIKLWTGLLSYRPAIGGGCNLEQFPICTPREGQPVPKSSKRSTTRKFKVGDHVTWNSEAGRVSGRILEVHTRNVDYKGYVHHASKDEPQYEIKSDKTDHVALHKGAALKLVRR
jgi:hypothetical protein